ncbi:hypothetical protein [Streptomyces yerevanensis]|uniref:hypothetical protein n=1 Tax=Streptomyces yerevanensis TaxID=66378 RepID=UPI000B01D89E
MKILGINALFHDPAAALLVDGHTAAAAAAAASAGPPAPASSRGRASHPARAPGTR